MSGGGIYREEVEVWGGSTAARRRRAASLISCGACGGIKRARCGGVARGVRCRVSYRRIHASRGGAASGQAALPPSRARPGAAKGPQLQRPPRPRHHDPRPLAPPQPPAAVWIGLCWPAQSSRGPIPPPAAGAPGPQPQPARHWPGYPTLTLCRARARAPIPTTIRGCKGDQISWLACLNSVTPCSLAGCVFLPNTDGSPNIEQSKNKCNKVYSANFTVAAAVTSLPVQLHDGQFAGTKDATAAWPVWEAAAARAATGARVPPLACAKPQWTCLSPPASRRPAGPCPAAAPTRTARRRPASRGRARRAPACRAPAES